MEARCRRTRSPVRRRCCGRSGMTRAWERDANAPYDTVVEVLTYGGKRFRARLLHDASMQEDETPCDQWQAEERSEEHTSELQSLMRRPYAVFCLKKKKKHSTH